MLETYSLSKFRGGPFDLSVKGRVEELVSARIFFSLASGAGNFLRAVHAFFYSHSCCVIFVLTVKALQEFFFSNLPLPLQRSTPYQFSD